MSEALLRCDPDDDVERDALIELFAAIETGALAGIHHGPVPVDNASEG